VNTEIKLGSSGQLCNYQFLRNILQHGVSECELILYLRDLMRRLLPSVFHCVHIAHSGSLQHVVP
jgi:hypothetical protein